eukprot:2613761-Amphidinium_carterae.1
MGDVNRPHLTLLHLLPHLQRRAASPTHLTTTTPMIPMNLHSGKVLKFTTLPHQDHQYQSWQLQKPEHKKEPRLKHQAADKTHQ